MINDFDVVQPGNVAAALEALAEGDGVMPLAGGTNVLVNIKHAPLEAGRLVDLTKIAELKTISEDAGRVRIGAGVTFTDLLEWTPGGALEQLMRPMCRAFAGPLIRNLATAGGNVCDASAAADISPVLLALDAKVELQSAANGKRSLALEEFFQGVRRTARRNDELLTALILDRPGDSEHGFYYKLGKRKADAISIVSVAMIVKIVNGKVAWSRIALGAVAPVAKRAYAAEKILAGTSLDETVIRKAARAALEDASPIDDFRSGADYRRRMVEVLVARGLENIRTA